MSSTRHLLLHAIALLGFVFAGILLSVDAVSWRDLLPVGVIALAGAILLAWVAGRSLSVSIAGLRDVTRALAAGDLSARPTLAGRGDLGELATALHRLAEEFGARISALESEDALLAALIDSLNEGVIAVNSRQQIVRINESGRRLLRVRDKTPFRVDRLPRDRSLHAAIQDALGGTSTDLLEIAIDNRLVSLTARPLIGGGAVVAFFDLTPVRRLEAVRRDFVANVSHELKTPLTIIGGFAETLVADDPPPERRKQFAGMIRSNALRMQRLVDDLLDLSRIESGGWVPNPGRVDVRAIATEIAGQLQDATAAKALSIEVDVDESGAAVWADRTALRQILTNLLENAVRHAAGGTVKVQTQPAAGGVYITVGDNGPGIPAEHLPRIFERFYRVDPGRSQASGGTGLGLAIVKHLVEAHGGHVRAESAVGLGTTIRVFFPNMPPQPA